MYQELWSGHEKLRRTDGQTDGQLDNFDECIKLKLHLLQFLLGALRVNIFRGSNSDILFIFAWLFHRVQTCVNIFFNNRISHAQEQNKCLHIFRCVKENALLRLTCCHFNEIYGFEH